MRKTKETVNNRLKAQNKYTIKRKRSRKSLCNCVLRDKEISSRNFTISKRLGEDYSSPTPSIYGGQNSGSSGSPPGLNIFPCTSMLLLCGRQQGEIFYVKKGEKQIMSHLQAVRCCSNCRVFLPDTPL